MVHQDIILISFGLLEEDFLNKIADSVRREYPFGVSLKEGHLDLSEFYDQARRQYDGTRIIKAVDSAYSTGSAKTIGLFSVDLFIPILTYIFGQALLGGQTGIASFYRLANERYGLKSNEAFVLDRFRKEVIHELGHTYGLIHCYVPGCVMRSSTYVEDIDQKSANLCPKCRKELDSMLQ